MTSTWGKDMFKKKGRTARNGLTGALLAVMVLTASGCASGTGYYPGGPTAGGYNYGGSPRTMGSSSVPPDYYYSDPSFCSHSNGFCPVLLGAAIVGIAAALAH